MPEILWLAHMEIQQRSLSKMVHIQERPTVRKIGSIIGVNYCRFKISKWGREDKQDMIWNNMKMNEYLHTKRRLSCTRPKWQGGVMWFFGPASKFCWRTILFLWCCLLLSWTLRVLVLACAEFKCCFYKTHVLFEAHPLMTMKWTSIRSMKLNYIIYQVKIFW